MHELLNKKVKIKVDSILKQGGHSRRFTEFLKQNKNTVFTATLFMNISSHDVYQLVEDNSNPKWMFYAKDLELVDS